MPRFGFVGASYTLQSAEVASEECINWFGETNESGGAFDMIQAYGAREYINLRSYYGTPGLKAFCTFPVGPVRGSISANGNLFVVAGPTFYQVTSDGTFTSLGTVANDGKAASLAFNSQQILVVSGGQAYCYSLTTTSWAPNTTYQIGAQIEDGASHIQKASQAAWQASTAYSVGIQIVDANGNIQQVTTAGTSAATVPEWNTTGTTDDNTVVWTYQSPAPTYAGISGATAPSFSDSGGTVVDGTGTLTWTDLGLRLLNVTSQLAGVPVQCDYSDTYFIVTFQNSNKFQTSQFLDGTNWPGQLVNEVSVFADNIVSLIANHRELWVLGNKRGQPYQDTGSAEIWDVIPGALLEAGSAATFSVCRIDNSVFWIGLDERGAVIAWRSNGYTPARISTHAVEVWLSQQANISSLVAYTYQDRGHLFWVLYVPDSNCSWVYDVGENLWHKRASWVNGAWGPHFSWNHSFAFGKHLVGDWNSANLYHMSFNYYDDNGTAIRRLRQAPTNKQELDRIYHVELRVDFDVGLGPQPPLLDGNNKPRPPQAILQWSNDGGKTWGNEHVRGCGMAGQTMTLVRWLRLGESRRRVYRVVVTDPIQWSIVDAYLKTVPGAQ